MCSAKTLLHTPCNLNPGTFGLEGIGCFTEAIFPPTKGFERVSFFDGFSRVAERGFSHSMTYFLGFEGGNSININLLNPEVGLIVPEVKQLDSRADINSTED